MSDKDLLVVISEMLRKQDQQAEKLDVHSNILNLHTEILNEHTGLLNRQIDISNQQTTLINETNNSLKQFVEISLQQFQEQHTSNELYREELKEQKQFNVSMLNKLIDIENALKK